MGLLCLTYVTLGYICAFICIFIGIGAYFSSAIASKIFKEKTTSFLDFIIEDNNENIFDIIFQSALYFTGVCIAAFIILLCYPVFFLYILFSYLIKKRIKYKQKL